MPKNRDSEKNVKRAERQVETAGKRPFHRVPKLTKLLRHVWARFGRRS
ncbi:MAG: hypothetical protein BWY68_00491 [bacterium ADurb.Bin400]|nr:MAG: hypothetical protein BWY68_00491 [bacterium ADurb.Bin400]